MPGSDRQITKEKPFGAKLDENGKPLVAREVQIGRNTLSISGPNWLGSMEAIVGNELDDIEKGSGPKLNASQLIELTETLLLNVPEADSNHEIIKSNIEQAKQNKGLTVQMAAEAAKDALSRAVSLIASEKNLDQDSKETKGAFLLATVACAFEPSGRLNDFSPQLERLGRLIRDSQRQEKDIENVKLPPAQGQQIG